MPKNTTGGNRHKKGKNKRVVNKDEQHESRIDLANANQVYAIVKSRAGGTRLQVECSDGQKRSAIIPGKFYKKVWMNPGDIILCELPDGNTSSCYVIYKYTPKEANTLKVQGHITFDVIQEVDEKDGYKFEDNTITPQKRNLDLNNIDDSLSLEEEDDDNDNIVEKPTVRKYDPNENNELDSDSIDLDDL